MSDGKPREDGRMGRVPSGLLGGARAPQVERPVGQGHTWCVQEVGGSWE